MDSVIKFWNEYVKAISESCGLSEKEAEKKIWELIDDRDVNAAINILNEGLRLLA